MIQNPTITIVAISGSIIIPEVIVSLLLTCLFLACASDFSFLDRVTYCYSWGSSSRTTASGESFLRESGNKSGPSFDPLLDFLFNQ